MTTFLAIFGAVWLVGGIWFVLSLAASARRKTPAMDEEAGLNTCEILSFECQSVAAREKKSSPGEPGCRSHATDAETKVTGAPEGQI